MSGVIWFLGPSGAGKTTLATGLAARLRVLTGGQNPVLLDGDEVRKGLSKDLKLSAEDRTENVRRVAEVAKLLALQGHWVICALMTPQRTQQEVLGRILEGVNHLVVAVCCDLEELISRDTKGLYAEASGGGLSTGLHGYNLAFEMTDVVDLAIKTTRRSVEESLAELVGSVVQEFQGFENLRIEISEARSRDTQI